METAKQHIEEYNKNVISYKQQRFKQTHQDLAQVLVARQKFILETSKNSALPGIGHRANSLSKFSIENRTQSQSNKVTEANERNMVSLRVDGGRHAAPTKLRVIRPSRNTIMGKSYDSNDVFSSKKRMKSIPSSSSNS